MHPSLMTEQLETQPCVLSSCDVDLIDYLPWTDSRGKIIAVDFDGCLCDSIYPECGEPNMGLIAMLKSFKRAGGRLILWTCREASSLQTAVNWCILQGLSFDAVNDNIEELKILYGNNSRKVYADLYIDDKACRFVCNNP